MQSDLLIGSRGIRFEEEMNEQNMGKDNEKGGGLAYRTIMITVLLWPGMRLYA